MKTFQLINQKGTVKYIGAVEGLPGEQLGVHLDNAKGKLDGSHNGKQYFSCPPKHGVFATYTQVKLLNEPLVPLEELKAPEPPPEEEAKSVTFAEPPP